MGLYNKVIDLQKLQEAWRRVIKNKPAAGVDHITYEDFERNKKEELRLLHDELVNHTYQARPVRSITLYQGEKARQLALYSMRDKVVQQSLANELNKLYEGSFSPSVYSYIANKSSILAIQRIDEGISSGKYSHFLKMDIHHFFDEIPWKGLEEKLKERVQEEDVMQLICENATTPILDDDGNIHDKNLGIHQGSVISPILSNIYLSEFDQWLQEKALFFIRYADDILILADTEKNCRALFQEMVLRLSAIGLHINEKKSYIRTIDEGIDFLGYHFDKSGKSIPSKAESSLQERLELMWLSSGSFTFEEKVRKASEILNGWEQYFRGEREISSIIEYVTVYYAAGGEDKYRKELIAKRKNFVNPYQDIMKYLSEQWKKYGEKTLELLEYEQFFQVKEREYMLSEAQGDTLLKLYRKYLISEDDESILDIMQFYTDLGEYETAKYWMQRDEQLKKKPMDIFSNVTIGTYNKLDLQVDKNTLGLMHDLFVGRDDIYAEETVNDNGRRSKETRLMPLTEERLGSHIAGKTTLDTYVQRLNSTAHFLVIDVDVSRKILLQFKRDSEEFKAYFKKALAKAEEIRKFLDSSGIQSYIEYSGNRGYHVWIFFEGWIQVRYANLLSDVIDMTIKEDPDLTIEYFPNKTRVSETKIGQCIKIPYGRHLATDEYSYFLDEDMNPETNLVTFLNSIARTGADKLKKVIASHSGKPAEASSEKKEEYDWSKLDGQPETVMEVLHHCSIMAYLVDKSIKTAYLGHMERLSILYVFGHLGNEGKAFIHKVMSFTLNYDYNVTEKFIRKMPEKPVSCNKLREQYRKISAELGCNCQFRHSKNCYPSPVLHAISLSNDISASVTLPVSKTVTQEKKEQALDEINIHRKTQDIVNRIVEMKKQKRGLERSIRKYESELSGIFDTEKIEELELPSGLLVRNKTENGYSFSIEI